MHILNAQANLLNAHLQCTITMHILSIIIRVKRLQKWRDIYVEYKNIFYVKYKI